MLLLLLLLSLFTKPLGTGIHDLPRFLRHSGLIQQGKRPLTVVLTHCHFDHSGGVHQFMGKSVLLLKQYSLRMYYVAVQ